MNKIQKLFLTIVSLLATTNVLGTNYHITIVNSNPSSGVLSLEANSDVFSGTHAPGTVTIYAKPTEAYYLEEIVIEYVMNLGGAESPRRRVDIGIGQKIVLNKTTAPTQFESNKENRYGGDYTFTMPSNDVEITATFKSASNFEANENITLAISGDDTYNGVARHLVVTNTLPGTPVTLAEGNDFQITRRKIKRGTEAFTDVDAIKDAGTYEIEITGLGTYYNSKTVNTLVINKANLTITPKNKSRQYRDANPTINYASADDVTYTGFQNGETHSVFSSPSNTPPTFTYSVNATVEASVATADSHTYTITASDAVAANYAISYSPGYLAITPRNVNDANTQAVATLSDNTYTLHTVDTKQYYKYNSNNVVTHQPTVTVTDPSDGDKVLTLGPDFSVAYSREAYGDDDCQTPGMYRATITFNGNYTGNAIIKQYQIRKEVTLNNSSNFRWRTFYDPTYNMEVIDGFQAFTVHGINDNAVLLDNRTVIKAGMPMLLFKPGTTYAGFYPPLIAPSDGRLISWTSDPKYKCKVDNVGNPINWILDSDGGITGGTTKIWILVDDKFARSKSGTLEAGKCYLDLSGTTYYAPMFNLGITPTGINEIEVRDTQKDNQFYDLSGRKVSYPKKGLYIQNGKKIIIK